MRPIILPLFLAALLASALLLIGWLLPATREGRAEAVIAAPPERILAVIKDVEAQPGWRPGISSVERTTDGWVEVTSRGERIAFVAEEMSAERVRLRFTSDAGYSGRWQAVLTPEGGGTRIMVTEEATVPSPLRRILARLFFDPSAFATTYLDALRARV